MRNGRGAGLIIVQHAEHVRDNGGRQIVYTIAPVLHTSSAADRGGQTISTISHLIKRHTSTYLKRQMGRTGGILVDL